MRISDSCLFISAGQFGKEEKDSIQFNSIWFNETVYCLLAALVEKFTTQRF